MRWSRPFSALIGLLVLAGCQTVSVQGDGGRIEEYRVKRPMGLFDVPARRAELAQDPALARDLCPPEPPRRMPASSVVVVGHGTKYTLFDNPFPFAPEWHYIDAMLAGWLRDGDRAYLEGLKDWLLASAAAGSFTNIRPDPDRFLYLDPLFSLRMILKPAFMAYDALRQEEVLDPAEDQRIHAWLEAVVADSDKGGCELENWCDRPNHTTLHRGTTFMLWGAVSGSDAWFQKGLAHFTATVSALRSDGSNAWDVVPKRANGSGGKRSLRKQNQVVGYLVVMAEIAALQGYDLYGAKAGETSLMTALDFLTRGIEDDAVVARHTGADWHGKMFLYESAHQDETVAWLELFARRFPDHPLVRRLAARVLAERPLRSAGYGGNLSCFVGTGAFELGKP